MKINYRILKVDEKEHSIIVRYYTDIITEDKLANSWDENGIARTEEGFPIVCRTDYNFNIWETPSPTEERIKEIIMNGAPVDWLRLQEQIANNEIDTTLSEVKPLENTASSFTVTI